MNPLWLVRMAQWLRHPPSPGRVKLVVAVILLCFLLFAIERFVGWPDWMTVNRIGRMPHF